MCLILYKPKHVKVDLDLLHSASQYNPHGYGLMALSGPQKIHVIRGLHGSFDHLRRACEHFTRHECVIHLRLRTRGYINNANTHPFKLTDAVYMAHNGTLDINCRVPGRSDSWHMANDVLSPLLQYSSSLLHNENFQRYLSEKIGSDNRMVFMDAHRQKTIIINEPLGIEFKGVWLSNTKWFDAARFGVAAANPLHESTPAKHRTRLDLLSGRFGQQFNAFHWAGRNHHRQLGRSCRASQLSGGRQETE